MSSVKIAVFVSGGGTNLQALIDAQRSRELDAEIALVLTNRSDAYAIERAKQHAIPYVHIVKNPERMLQELREHYIDFIVLAGYLAKVPDIVTTHFAGCIINLHPSLLPKYSGKGFYGLRVHQAVLDAGDTITGATVHFVDDGIDTGAIIQQVEVPVLPEDTAETLQARVLQVEHKLLAETTQKLVCKLVENKI